MHSVTLLLNVESMIGKSNNLEGTYLNELPGLVETYDYVFSWEGQAIGRSYVI